MLIRSAGQAVRKHPLFRLVPYLSKYRSRLFWGTLTVLFTNVAAVISPLILKEAINFLTSEEISSQRIVFYAGLMITVSLFEGLFRFLMRRIMIGVSRFIEYDLRNDLGQHLQTLSPSFYQNHQDEAKNRIDRIHDRRSEYGTDRWQIVSGSGQQITR
jgi:ATP-binding cassette subfamily B protein